MKLTATTFDDQLREGTLWRAPIGSPPEQPVTPLEIDNRIEEQRLSSLAEIKEKVLAWKRKQLDFEMGGALLHQEEIAHIASEFNTLRGYLYPCGAISESVEPQDEVRGGIEWGVHMPERIFTDATLWFHPMEVERMALFFLLEAQTAVEWPSEIEVAEGGQYDLVRLYMSSTDAVSEKVLRQWMDQIFAAQVAPALSEFLRCESEALSRRVAAQRTRAH
jgi:hypothetical protein